MRYNTAMLVDSVTISPYSRGLFPIGAGDMPGRGVGEALAAMPFVREDAVAPASGRPPLIEDPERGAGTLRAPGALAGPREAPPPMPVGVELPPGDASTPASLPLGDGAVGLLRSAVENPVEPCTRGLVRDGPGAWLLMRGVRPPAPGGPTPKSRPGLANGRPTPAVSSFMR